jgi:hypothetical protein
VPPWKKAVLAIERSSLISEDVSDAFSEAVSVLKSDMSRRSSSSHKPTTLFGRYYRRSTTGHVVY